MKKGLFITFEGADGCGKTTQLTLLDEYFNKAGRKTLLTREPGWGFSGQKSEKSF